MPGLLLNRLPQVREVESEENIEAITQCLIRQLEPVKIFLFGSFADGSYTEDSDYDFYIVMGDGSDLNEASRQAYRSIRYIKNRPVDIVLGTRTRFEQIGGSPDSLYVEGEVMRNGVLLYDNDALSAEVAV